MAIIYSYPQIGELLGDNILLVSDTANGNNTKLVTVTQLSDYVIDQAFNGTSNKIPLFTSTSTIGDSVITQINDKIGIGTDNPTAKLDVDGNVNVTGDLTVANGYIDLGYNAYYNKNLKISGHDSTTSGLAFDGIQVTGELIVAKEDGVAGDAAVYFRYGNQRVGGIYLDDDSSKMGLSFYVEQTPLNPNIVRKISLREGTTIGRSIGSVAPPLNGLLVEADISTYGNINASGNITGDEVTAYAVTASDVNVLQDVKFVDYGSGTKTGVGTYMLSVDADGNIKEFRGTANFLPIVSDSGGYLDKSPLSVVNDELISNTNIAIRSDAVEVAKFVSSNSLRCSVKLVNNNGAEAYITSSDESVSIGGNDGLTNQNLNVTRRGRVGIGTSSPKSTLEVRGYMTLSANLPGSTGKIKFNDGFSETTIAALEYLNEGDVFHIKSENPSGASSKIKFSVAKNGEPAEEAMRIVGRESVQGKPRVIIGNPNATNSTRELYVDGEIEVTGSLNRFEGSLSVDGRVDADNYKLKGLNTAPATATSPGVLGEIRYTADYIYVCVQNNVWKRTALTTW